MLSVAFKTLGMLPLDFDAHTAGGPVEHASQLGNLFD